MIWKLVCGPKETDWYSCPSYLLRWGFSLNPFDQTGWTATPRDLPALSPGVLDSELGSLYL